MADDMDSSESLKQMGDRIRKIREERRLSQFDLAAMAERSSTYISDVENGKRDVKAMTLIQIADALEVPFSAIQPTELDKYSPFPPGMEELVNLLGTLPAGKRDELIGMFIRQVQYTKEFH